jgi:NAD(P)H dehydrogenase (quinone)
MSLKQDFVEKKNILILFDSQTGGTQALARYIAMGVDEAAIQNNWPIQAILRTVPKVSPVNEAVAPVVPSEGIAYVSIQELQNCIGLALGSPTYFGNMSSHLKYFLEQTSKIWIQGELSGKPACVFNSTGSLHGGHESTLLSMMLPLMHHGMMILSLPYLNTGLMHSKTGGTPYGVTHHGHHNCPPENPLSEEEIKMSKAMGQRLAITAYKINQNI